MAGDPLPGVAGHPPDHRLLDRRPAQRLGDQGTQLGELRRTGQRPGLPGDHLADGPHGDPRHPHRRGHRLPDRLLHGEGGGAEVEGGAGRRGADATLGELPGEDHRLAGDPRRTRGAELGAPPDRPARSRQRGDLGLAGDELPLAAVHDPADLRRAGADPGLADRRLRGPRRPPLHHLPQGDPAARVPSGGGGLDLHLLAHPRRLPGAETGLQRTVHRHRRSSTRSPTTSRSRRPWHWCRSSS